MPRTGLKTKLIALVIGVGTIPLVLAMILSYVQGNKSLINVIGSSFKALAYESAAKIDFLIEVEINKNSHLTNHPTLILAVKFQNKRFEDIHPSEVKNHFAEQSLLWQKEDPRMQPFLANASSRILKTFLHQRSQSNLATTSLYLTDSKGLLVASTNFYPDFVDADHPAQKFLKDNPAAVFIGQLHHSQKTNKYVFEMVLPIKSPEGEIIGLFHRAYSAKDFFKPSIEPIIFGETGRVMLIDSDGVVIDCPILPTGTKLEDPELVRSVTKPEANWAKTIGDGHGNKGVSIIGFAPAPKTSLVTLASHQKKWFTFTWQSSEELFSPTKDLLLWTSAAGFFSILLLTLLGALSADKFVGPIRELQKTAAAIGRGEKVEPLKIKTGDEIELLSDEINHMKSLLDKAFTGLEDEVRIKTKEALYLKEYTKSILMSVPSVLIVFNEKLQIELVNAAFEKLTGAKGPDVIGKTLIDAHLKFSDKWEDLAEQLGSFANSEVNLVSRDYKGKDPLAPSTVKNQRDKLPTINYGDYIFAYQFFEIGIKEDDSRHIGLILKDITEEKSLMDRLTLADKLSGLGTMAAGIAHEMNNPLFAIMGYSEAILRENEPSKIKNFASKIFEQSKHMSSVILNLTGYTSPNQDELCEVNLNERLDAAVGMALLASYSDDIVLEKNYSSIPLITVKPEEIQQIFLNILRNAVQAMDGKGKLFLTSRQIGENIVVNIGDSGPGIPSEFISKVFDPFFTTKEQGKGTGLGLNIVHGLVEKYNGRIEVESKMGEGTTFTITFPVETDKPAN